MKVKLLHYTPLEVADIAISKCYDKKPYEELIKQQSRINKVANVSKHSSTIEHLNYNFDIDGVSRALLQELARHRIASYTVKSTRYTLKELRDDEDITLEKYCVIKNLPDELHPVMLNMIKNMKYALKDGYSNDVVKYCLPEAYKTSLVMTINARSLQNFLSLRTDSHALWEIQDLARAMYDVIPEDHKFIFEGYVK